MKNLKYKNVELQYKPDTGNMVNAEILNKKKKYLDFCISLSWVCFFSSDYQS